MLTFWADLSVSVSSFSVLLQLRCVQLTLCVRLIFFGSILLSSFICRPLTKQRRESNPGRLGGKRKRFLCAMPSPQLDSSFTSLGDPVGTGCARESETKSPFILWSLFCFLIAIEHLSSRSNRCEPIKESRKPSLMISFWAEQESAWKKFRWHQLSPQKINLFLCYWEKMMIIKKHIDRAL